MKALTERVDDGFNRAVSPLSPSFDTIFHVRVKKREPVEVLQLHRLKSMQRLGTEAYKDVMEKYLMSAEERALAYRCFGLFHVART